MSTEHHPLCDDDGWDHPGECIVETEFPADPDDPNGWTVAHLRPDVEDGAA